MSALWVSIRVLGPARDVAPAWASIPCKCRVFKHWPGMLRHAARRQYNKLNPILFLYPTVLQLLARSAVGVIHYGLAILQIILFTLFFIYNFPFYVFFFVIENQKKTITFPLLFQNAISLNGFFFVCLFVYPYVVFVFYICIICVVNLFINWFAYSNYFYFYTVLLCLLNLSWSFCINFCQSHFKVGFYGQLYIQSCLATNSTF